MKSSLQLPSAALHSQACIRACGQDHSQAFAMAQTERKVAFCVGLWNADSILVSGSALRVCGHPLGALGACLKVLCRAVCLDVRQAVFPAGALSLQACWSLLLLTRTQRHHSANNPAGCSLT